MVNQCRICRNFKTTSLIQKMAPLPAEQWHHPHRSPMSILIFWDLCTSRTNSKKLKRLMSVYLRVVQHVQYISSSLARSMTIESYLLPLKRMTSRRGKIDAIWSDNFKSFKNADKELRQSRDVISSDFTQERVQGMAKFVGISFPPHIPLGRILWEIGEVSEDTLKRDACKSDVDWTKKKWGQHLK